RHRRGSRGTRRRPRHPPEHSPRRSRIRCPRSRRPPRRHSPPHGTGRAGASSTAGSWAWSLAPASWPAACRPYRPAARRASPAQPPAAAPAQPAPRHGPGWRLVYGGFMGVLVVACIVVGVLLAVRAGSEPSFTGPAVENLQAAPNSAGVYQVTVPDGLPIPDD